MHRSMLHASHPLFFHQGSAIANGGLLVNIHWATAEA
jgi:hypothetical protein